MKVYYWKRKYRGSVSKGGCGLRGFHHSPESSPYQLQEFPDDLGSSFVLGRISTMLGGEGSKTLESDANEVSLLAMLAVLLHVRIDVVAQRYGLF